MYESRGLWELVDETLAFRTEVSAIIFRNVPPPTLRWDMNSANMRGLICSSKGYKHWVEGVIA